MGYHGDLSRGPQATPPLAPALHPEPFVWTKPANEILDNVTNRQATLDRITTSATPREAPRAGVQVPCGSEDRVHLDAAELPVQGAELERNNPGSRAFNVDG